MMNIEPPGIWDWLLLVGVGALAGSINGLRRYAQRGQKESILVGAIEGATALFVTITCFLILYSVLPLAFGINLSSLGLIGISGAVAHIGLRQSIRMALRIAENTTRD
jgi:hypothetical protein